MAILGRALLDTAGDLFEETVEGAVELGHKTGQLVIRRGKEDLATAKTVAKGLVIPALGAAISIGGGLALSGIKKAPGLGIRIGRGVAAGGVFLAKEAVELGGAGLEFTTQGLGEFLVRDVGKRAPGGAVFAAQTGPEPIVISQPQSPPVGGRTQVIVRDAAVRIAAARNNLGGGCDCTKPAALMSANCRRICGK